MCEEIMSLEERKNDDYQVILHESYTRQQAADDLIERIEKMSKRNFDECDKVAIKDRLCWFEVEECYTVFMADGAPKDKQFIGKIELRTEYISLYFGRNRAVPEAYSLGIHFSTKKENDVVYFSEATFKARFPEMSVHILPVVHEGPQYILKVYPKAGLLYQKVRQRPGMWLGQTPTATGQFVPNRGIGFIEEGSNVVHICDPKATLRVNHMYNQPCEFYN